MVETLDIRSDGALHANDWAVKYGVSRRTVTRYVQEGKIEAFRRKGRTYIVDRKPIETSIQPEQAERMAQQDIQSGQPGQLERPSEDFLLRMGQLSLQAKTGRKWQALAIGFIVVAFIGVTVSTWIYASLQATEASLVSAQETAATLTENLRAAGNNIETLQEGLIRAQATATAAQTVSQSLKETLEAERQRYGELQLQVSGMTQLLLSTPEEIIEID